MYMITNKPDIVIQFGPDKDFQREIMVNRYGVKKVILMMVKNSLESEIYFQSL